MKILVRLPNWLGDIMMSFPFLHALKQEFPDATIMAIVKPQYKDLMELLPFKVEVFEYDKKRDGSFPHEIHKYCVNQKLLFNIDIYFCLPPSFSSAFMGQAFRAKYRVGFKGEWRSFLFTHKKEWPKNFHRYQEYLELLKLYLNRDFPLPQKILSRSFEPYFQEATEPYTVINVNSEASSRRLPAEQWIMLLSPFQNKKFVFIGMEKDQSRVQEVIDRLPSGRNTYINLAGKTNILELSQLLSHSQGLISNDSGPAHLASYVGTSVVVFFGAGDPENTAPTYSKGAALIVKKSIECSPCLKNECPLKTLDCLRLLPIDKNHQEIQQFLYE
jgi:lipopolysaccharide heptosyltransferase II